VSCHNDGTAALGSGGQAGFAGLGLLGWLNFWIAIFIIAFSAILNVAASITNEEAKRHPMWDGESITVVDASDEELIDCAPLVHVGFLPVHFKRDRGYDAGSKHSWNSPEDDILNVFRFYPDSRDKLLLVDGDLASVIPQGETGHRCVAECSNQNVIGHSSSNILRIQIIGEQRPKPVGRLEFKNGFEGFNLNPRAFVRAELLNAPRQRFRSATGGAGSSISRVSISPIHLNRVASVYSQEDNTNDRDASFYPLPLPLVWALTLFGLIITGYCWRQANFRFDDREWLWVISTFAGAFLFAYGFSVLMDRIRDIL
jgi:hypothetical protein